MHSAERNVGKDDGDGVRLIVWIQPSGERAAWWLDRAHRRVIAQGTAGVCRFGSHICRMSSRYLSTAMIRLDLVWLCGIPVTNTLLQLVKAYFLTCDKLLSLGALVSAEGMDEASMRFDRSSKFQRPCNSRVGLALLAESDYLRIHVPNGRPLSFRRPGWLRGLRPSLDVFGCVLLGMEDHTPNGVAAGPQRRSRSNSAWIPSRRADFPEPHVAGFECPMECPEILDELSLASR